MSLLSVDNLTIRYATNHAVRDLSFSVERGESLGLVGESGSGKTQAALAILGLLPRSAAVTGSILLEDRELLGATERDLNRVRALRIAMVFQDPMQALNPFLRIGQQLSRILRVHGLADSRGARAKVVAMLERVGLPDAERQFRAYPHQLSGGMRQRAMIASALITGPELLIADEPTTALDVTVQAQILELLEELRENTALLLITHDLGIIAGRCERMLVLKNGELVEQGPTRNVFAAPAHEHTASLLAAAATPELADDRTAAVGNEILQVDDASVSYREPGHAALDAVRAVDLTVREGETVAVVGESGSGKSSLVRAVLGLVPMRSGRAVFCGSALRGTAQERAADVRRGLQLVFQDPLGSLNPQMRVVQLVAEPLLVHEPGLSQDERQAKVVAMLVKTGLGDAYLDRYPHELSGGQAQRVAIARALILEPKVLICDEAVAALDGTVRRQILALLGDLQRETGLAIVFISHDLSVVRSVSHRVLVMYMGALVELATTRALFDRPRHPYTRALLDAVPIPDPDNAGGKATLAGEVPSILSPPGGCPFHPRCQYAIDVCAAESPGTKTIEGTTVVCHRAGDI